MPETITEVDTQNESLRKQQTPPNQKTEIGQKSDKVNNGGITGQQQGGNIQDRKTEDDAKKEMDGIDGKHAGAGAGAGAGSTVVEKLIGYKENQVITGPQTQRSYRIGMGMSFRIKQSRRGIVNVTVAIAVVAALGVYAKYRLQHSVQSES